jgi:hypothetical protein
VHLSELTPADSFSHGGVKNNTNYLGNAPVSLGGRKYARSVLICPENTSAGAGARAHVTYDLAGPLANAKRFRAVVGIDDGGDRRGSVVFGVDVRRKGKWQQLYRSGVLRHGPGRKQVHVDVDIHGADQLRLSVTDAGDGISSDHAAWADAKLE